MKVVKLSALRTGQLYPQETSLVQNIAININYISLIPQLYMLSEVSYNALIIRVHCTYVTDNFQQFCAFVIINCFAYKIPSQ